MKRVLAPGLLLLLQAAQATADEPADEDQQMLQRLQEALRAQQGEIHRCYGAALDRDPKAGGELLMKVQIGEGARVARAEVLKDQTHHAPGLQACLTESIGRWSLPQLKARPGDLVVFPLIFRPDDVQKKKKP